MKTITLPVDTRTIYWESPDGKSAGNFRPTGKIILYEELRRNPELWSSEKSIWSSRLLVGFNVNNKPKWTLKNLIPIVKRVRVEQVQNASATFLLQKGLYTHKVRGRPDKTIEENGAQVIIINLPEFKTSAQNFTAQMVELAEAIAAELDQAEIIVEIQKNGIQQRIIGVEPAK